MNRRTIFWLGILAALPSLLKANAAGGDPHLERLFATFIAPCCWRENLLTHSSPKADELRTEIRNAVGAGRTDEEIKQNLIRQYSLRILTMPEGARGQWLITMPVVVLAAGMGSITWFVRKSISARNSQPVPETLPELPEIEDF